MFFHFVFSLYLPHPLEFLRVLSLEKSRATRVTFRDQKHWNRLKDKKVIAKNNPKIQRIFVFFGFFFHFVFSNSSQTLWCFQSLFAGPVAVHAGNFLQQRKLKSVEKQKSYKKKNKKQYVFFLFFCFFHFVFWPNFRTLRSFRSRFAACGCCYHSASFETKNIEIEWKTKKLEQKNKNKNVFFFVFLFFSFCFFLITSEPFGVSACSWPRKVAGDARDFSRPRTRKSNDRQKS